MRRRCERFPGALAALITLVVCVSSTALDGAVATAGPHGSLSVEGYVVGWGGGAGAYLSDRRTVDEIGVDGVEVTPDADGITAVAGPAKKALRAAHAHRDTGELLVSNYSDSLGDFDPALARRLLGSDVHRSKVAAALARVVRRQGWDGIQIDLESLGRPDGTGLAAFATQLRSDLPSTASLSMAVMAEGSRASYGRHGYLLGQLGAVDRFVLMAYDQHGPGWSGPGPVGALPWARRAAAPLIRAVGRGRVDLGIAGYGYLWRHDGSGRTVSDARARRLAGDAARWHARAGEWSAHLGKGTLWWSDHRSYERRVALAHHLRLHGVAVWQLGSADPLGRAGV
ncbi:MAG TPA: glycosyl hydrolase family 18 protein [Nocardioides sp.]|jgi:spore germination protein YaaH|uniref:glycosyl hydrolase family 18 protein n=1 Tax=Nocardioides sp. TaxID=35761 RepID=UPI002E345B37|nr:glycosyl hydrolase family 18 protein [Nocardioides sp.]HEX3932849.1 glycosyl hydrolase family 18 protein [Nocardioides sp.]